MTRAECRTHPGKCCTTRPRAQLPRDENKSVPNSRPQFSCLCEEKLDPCDGTETPILADDFRRVYQSLKKADGIIFGTPTYWFTMSGLMKNFIDRLTVTEGDWMLENKVAGFVATGDREEDGAMAALSSIASAVNHLGMATFPYSLLYFRGKGSRWAREDHRQYAKRMLEMIRVMRAYKS